MQPFLKEVPFLFHCYTPEKIGKCGDELEWVNKWRNIIQFSDVTPKLFLMFYLPETEQLLEAECMDVFRNVKHTWFQVQWIKCLKTEAWMCLSISLPSVKKKDWLEYLLINYEWIFVLAYTISPLPKQHCKAILALIKSEKERKA